MTQTELTPTASISGKWKPYPAYKDSGVEWLGEIPAHWKTQRLKYAAPSSKAKLTEKTDDLPYIGLENIESQTGRLLLDTPIEIVESTVGLFYKGDVLFGKLRPYLAKVVCVDFSGVCTTELLVLQPNAIVNGKFLFYRLLSEDFIKLVNSLTYGTKMPRVSSEQIGNLPIPFPLLGEQCAIAAFLDRETAIINALIAKKERLIELLQEKRAALISHAVTKGLDPAVPMKDSGVEWLGEIPAHWEVKRLKFVADVLTGVAKGRDLGQKDVVELPYLRVANVQDGYLDLTDIASIIVGADEVERYSLKYGDVLMNEGGDFDKLGRGYVWEETIAPCLHQNHVFAVRPHLGVDSFWISIITLTSYAKHFFILRSKQSTNLASISGTNLKELPVLMPPESERDEILLYIKDATAKIDALISRIGEGIEKLKEYSTALISAAVTGKIDVRDD
jgi:type I restriction enzyme, S subunit